ncbi:MAG: hypothetical protein ACXVUL_15480 [Solirubrobacteraceae bacterium]
MLVVIASLLAVVSGAFAAGTSGGSVKMFGTPKGSGGAFMFTGAIGDFGSTQRQTASGSPSANGDFVKFTLKHGTFVADATGFFNALNHARFSFDKATCSASFGASGPATLSAGTGQYAGISGTLKVTGTFADVGPRLKNGKCNTGQKTKPLAQFQAVTGTGHVSFG